MKILYLFVLLTICSIRVNSQSTLPLRADTVVIEKTGGNANLKIKDANRDSLGILYNAGGGLIRNKRARKLNDSTIIVGNDTITVGGTGQNLQQVTDRGSKTTDTISVGGVRTKNIITDTTDKPTFRIILKPDTQNEVRYSWPYQLDSVAKWIEDSASYYNTKAFLGLGDITDLGNVTEMSRMDSFYMRIAAAGLVYMPILGNHDYDNFSFASVSNRLTTIYNTYFGPSRFTGDSWYGGNLDGKNDNFYTKFDAEGHKFLVVGLEYNPRDSALEWAQRVCDSFPDRETIIITHAYITAYNEKSVDTSSNTMSYGDIGNTGQEIWDKFIKKNKQIFLVAAGHYVHGGANLPAFGRIIQPGLNGNVVTQILSNYQSDTLDGYASGEGFLMTLDFDLRAGKINFNVYSPFLKKYHPTFVPFSIDYPSVNVEASVGVSSVNGNFNVAGSATLDSTVHVTQLTKNRLMVVGKNGLLDTLENVAANSFLASTGITTRPRYRTLLSTDIPAGSSNYIQNQIATGQTSNFWVYNPTFPDFTGVGVISKTATYRTTVTSGVPMTLIVAHGGSNYGLGIQRASANVSPAHLSFFKNYGSDFTTLVANGVGDQIGSINWHGVTAGLGVTLPASIHAYVERNDATALTTGLVFNTKDSANVTRSMYLNSRGNLLLGGSSPSNAYRLRVNGPVAFDLGSDANYDTYYRNAAGAFTRLPAGTDGYVLTTHSTSSAPTWEAATSGADGNGIYGGNGSLPSDVTVTGGSNGISFNSTRTGVNATMNISNTSSGAALSTNASGSGTAIEAGSSTGYGGNIFSTSGPGLQVSSSSNTGLLVNSTTAVPVEIQTAPTSTNTDIPLMSLYRKTSGTASANIAGHFAMYNENGSGSDVLSNKITSKLTTVTGGAEVSSFEIWGINGGTLATKFTILGTGQIHHNAYGSGTFTVTPATTPVYSSTGLVGERIAPKIYTALLTQSGTGDPTATILGTNEIGTIVWTRNSTGNYTGTLTGAFTANKTWLICQKGDGNGSFVNGLLSRSSDNALTLDVRDNIAVATDNFTNMSIEIRVYP